MIASYACNLIFLKSRKTGGTSVEIVLSSWCSGADICSPIGANDELTRCRYGGRAQNFCKDPSVEEAFNEAVAAGDIPRIRAISQRYNAEYNFRNHMKASDVREKLPDLWQSAFKFTVERHPYEKAVSMTWAKLNGYGQNRSSRDFDSELAVTIGDGHFVNYPIYTIDGVMAVDEVIPYERAWERIGALGAKHGKVLPKEIPRAKGTFRSDRRPAREVLSDIQMEAIYKVARPEFELFGFEP